AHRVLLVRRMEMRRLPVLTALALLVSAGVASAQVTVVGYTPAAPVVSAYAPAPVVSAYAPAPVVTQSYGYSYYAPVVSAYTPAPVVAAYTPAPVVVPTTTYY